MPTNDERREVAARMRDYVDLDFEDANPYWYVMKSAYGDVSIHGDNELFSRLADLIEPDPERTCMDVNEAWSDFGANVFSDDALDDFDKFEKVYQICQEIVERLEFTCWIERTEQDEFGSYDYLSCGHIAMRQWPEKTRYCPSCGAKVM